MRSRPQDADVVIVGGGIAGLANAYALALDGHRVQVLERESEFAEVGAGLQLAPNATRILKEWGLLEEVIEAGVRPEKLVFRDALDGSMLTQLDLGNDFVDRYGAPYVVIHRNDLLTILVNACRRAGVELVVDCAVESVRNEQDSAVAVAGDRGFSADVVLAADGLRSSFRKGFSADEPVGSGYVAYRGAFSLEELSVTVNQESLNDVTVHLGPGFHLVQYALRRGEVLNTVAVFKSPGFARGDQNWGGPEELSQVFADACPDVRRGLDSLWTDRRWPMYDRLPIRQWVNGRVALTGDAAHPMLQYLAQGACQAIEDAHALSAVTGKPDAGREPDWPAALAAYETVRTARTARVQSSARVWGEMWHVDGVARLMRNELFRMRALQDYSHIDWLYGNR